MKQLHAIIQAATVELFKHYAVAVAPIPVTMRSPDKGAPRDLVGVVGFSVPGKSGSLTLCLPPALLELMTRSAPAQHYVRDFLSELTNRLMGRIKNRMTQFQVHLRTELPKVVENQFMSRSVRDETDIVQYVFRSLRGDVVVTLFGTIDVSPLKYTGAEIIREGEVILFDGDPTD